MAKEPSEKQLAARAKFAAASKAKAAERKAQKTPEAVSLPKAETLPVDPSLPPQVPVEPVPEPKDPGSPQDPSVDQLQRVVLETLQNLFGGMTPQQPQGGATLTDTRGIVGTKERYPVNPSLYPDPRERLAQEDRLKPVAFTHNYEIDYKCNPTRRYQTQDGIWQVEPQFTLELNRVILDERTGERTKGRYTICRGIFFEDPDTAIMMAAEMGQEVPEDNQFDFLNEMRYIRMRDWLLEAFYAPLDTSPKSNKKEMVIDGKMVDFFEVSGEEAQSIPFDELKSKLKA